MTRSTLRHKGVRERGNDFVAGTGAVVLLFREAWRLGFRRVGRGVKGKQSRRWLFLAEPDSQTISLRVLRGHHVEVGARRTPEPSFKISGPGLC